jgi:hypothetical protein
MSEWWTYRLADFLMFSPATYWRLVERYNRESWPLQIAWLVAGVALLGLVARRTPRAGRVAAAVLAIAWLWVGWGFYGQRYAAINWAAPYFGAAFVLQSALLAGTALLGKQGDADRAGDRAHAAGLVLAAIAVLLYPVVAPATGRPWGQAEVFGLMPEPTALATLGLLLATRLPLRAGLAAIPLLSLAVGLATAWLLRS